MPSRNLAGIFLNADDFPPHLSITFKRCKNGCNVWLHFVKDFGPISVKAWREDKMVATIGMLGVATGILAAAIAFLSGLSILGVVVAYCLTGSLAAFLVVGAVALCPRAADDDTAHDAQTA